MFILNPYSKNSIRKHLIGYYPFDSDFDDKIPPFANLLPNNIGIITISAGRVGNASWCPAGTNTVLRNYTNSETRKYSFSDGVNDIPYSISFHFYIISAGHATVGTLLEKGINGSSAGFTNAEWSIQYNKTSGQIRFFKYSEGSLSNYIVYSVTAPPLNTWFHLVITDDAAGNVKIYLNGVEQFKSTANGGSGFVKFSITKQSVFGGFNLPGVASVNYYVEGGLDDLGVWADRVLTQDDIDWIYNGGNPRPLM